MPREGHINTSLAKEDMKILDKIAERERCRTRPEAIRKLIRVYEESTGVNLGPSFILDRANKFASV